MDEIDDEIKRLERSIQRSLLLAAGAAFLSATVLLAVLVWLS